MRGLGATAELVGLVLESTAAPGLPPAVFRRLAACTLEVNPRLGLTGELRLEDGCFSLSLEGRSELLLPLAARILADPRHRRIRVGAFGAIAERRFSGWCVEGFDLDEAPAGTTALCFAAAHRVGRDAARPRGAIGV